MLAGRSLNEVINIASVSRERRRIVGIRYPMLPALGLLLVLTDAGAVHQQSNLLLSYANTSFGFPGTTSNRGISVTRILQDGELERVIRLPGICAKETIVNWG